MQKPSVSVLAAAIGVVCIGLASIAHPTPMLVWNASTSVPIGLYRVVSGTPQRGDLALVRTPDSIEGLADRRGYLPFGVPLVKHIAAVPGDDVCAFHGAIIIDGRIVAHQLEADRAGRILPRWSGCGVLRDGEFFLLNDAEDSFDSRYFGQVARAQVIGRLKALWTE